MASNTILARKGRNVMQRKYDFDIRQKDNMGMGQMSDKLEVNPDYFFLRGINAVNCVLISLGDRSESIDNP